MTGNGRSNRALRLLIWTDCVSLGGIGEFNHSLALGLSARNFEIVLVGPQFDVLKTNAERLHGVRHFEVMLPECRLTGVEITTYEATEKLIREISPDVVLFSDGSAISSLLAKQVASAIGLPMIFSVGLVHQSHVSIARANAHFAEIYSAAHRVVCVSKHNQNMLTEKFPLTKTTTIVIHYGRPAIFFEGRNETRRTRLRDELGVSSTDVLFLTSARYDAIKGYDLLSVALNQLKRRPIWPGIKFAWAGDGPLRPRLMDYLARQDLDKHVRLLGERNDIAALLDAADAFVMPSYAEGMPLAIMEAMAKALPVIATSVSGIPEEIGEAGILVGDPAASPSNVGRKLVQGLEMLALNSSKRDDLGRRAKQRAEIMFREERMVSDYWQLCTQAHAAD